MKKYFGSFMLLAMPVVALAHGEEGVGVGAQLNELLPFVHFQEGHIVAGVVSIALWLALVYVAVTLVQKRKL